MKVDISQAILSPDFLYRVAASQISGLSLVDISGAVQTGSTTVTIPITDSGTYQQPTAAASLEALSGHADDTAAGSGARSIKIWGLDDAWALQDDTISLSGTTPVPFTKTFRRMFKAEVLTAGTFCDYNARNNHGEITIRGASAGPTWGKILVESATRGYGRSHIGAYTIPAGYNGYILPHIAQIMSSGGGSTGILVNPTPGTIAAPFVPMNMVQLTRGHISGPYRSTRPIGPLVGPCDIVWIGIAASGTTPPMSVDAPILLERVTA